MFLSSKDTVHRARMRAVNIKGVCTLLDGLSFSEYIFDVEFASLGRCEQN